MRLAHTHHVTPIQKLVMDRLAELDRSVREAAEISGRLISHGYLNQIQLGRLPDKFSPKIVRGLALALDVPQSVVEKAVKDSDIREVVEFRLPARAGNLTPKEQKAVLSYVDALLSHRTEKGSSG